MKLLFFICSCACILVGTLVPAQLSAADPMDGNLVARWTFSDGSLTSDVGDYTFVESGQGAVRKHDGMVTLGGKKYLVCEQINSENLPELRRSVTIWARLRFDVFPAQREATVLSLQSVVGNGGWKEIVFALVYRGLDPTVPRNGLSFLARTASEHESGIGVSRFQPIAQGDFVDVALVFDGRQETSSMYVNGNMVSTKVRNASELRDFASLAIGSLTELGAPCVVTFDEVRVYALAIDAEWLSEISPIK